MLVHKLKLLAALSENSHNITLLLFPQQQMGEINVHNVTHVKKASTKTSQDENKCSFKQGKSI